MKACLILALMVALWGCNPICPQGVSIRVIPESEMPDAVRETAMAAKPNAQAVGVTVSELGLFSKIVSYSVAVREDSGNRWLLEISPDGKLMSTLSVDEILGDAEATPRQLSDE